MRSHDLGVGTLRVTFTAARACTALMLLPCCTCGDLVNADDGVAPILAKAMQLMGEAGYPNGFNVDWLTPAPPFYSRGERVIAQLQQIGIRTRLQVLERAIYQKRQQSGMKEWPGVNILFTGARVGASWANWYESE